jgi:hypothetical protein
VFEHSEEWFVHGRAGAVMAKVNCWCHLLNHKLAGVDGALDVEPAVQNDDLGPKKLPEAINKNCIAALSGNETYSDCLLSASFVSCEVCLAAGQESNGECAQNTHAQHMNHLHV